MKDEGGKMNIINYEKRETREMFIFPWETGGIIGVIKLSWPEAAE